MGRATWDETFLEMASAMAKRSECVRSRVGAVVVDGHNRVVASGYNGRPERMRAEAGEDCSRFCPRGAGTAPKEDCPSIHAEANALLWGSRDSRAGGTIYITRAPCLDCAKLVANSGLRRAVWLRTAEDSPQRVEPVLHFLHGSDITTGTYR